MIVDIHNHPDWYGHDFNKFIANMAQYNIDVTWLLSCETPAGEYDPRYDGIFHSKGNGISLPFNNSLPYAAREPDKFVLGYAPDPRKPDSIDKLAEAIENCRVRICGEMKLKMMYDNPDALRMFRFCGEKGLPVLVHIGIEETKENYESLAKYGCPDFWFGGGLEPFERALQACPETIFLGHASGFWAHISGDDRYDKEWYPAGKIIPGGKVVTMLRQNPNLYCDLSAGSGHNALSRDIEFTKQFIFEFQDRLLYGRDYFDNRHQELLNSLSLPQSILDKIYYKNALKLVPLEGMAT